MNKVFILAVILFTANSSFSQARVRTQLSGRVTDAQTGEVLQGASVIIADTKVGTSTNKEGVFTFNNIPTGHAIIEVSYAGYETLVDHVDVTKSTQANFQLKRSVREYEGVTVTGVAGATSIRKAPIPVTRVNKTELLATPSTNIIDALSKQPGVTQLSTGPAVSKPVIRGLGYNRLVTINDGVRQEGQQWGDEHGIEIDENSVSRVEILKGPASLIYGSDAIAGVVNIITTSPVENNTLSGSILSSYQTNNQQHSLFGNLGASYNGFNWNVWGDYVKASDYRNKYDGKVSNSQFKSGNAGGYIGYNGVWGFSHLIVSSFNQEIGIVEGERDINGNFAGSNPYQKINHAKIVSDNSFKVGTGRLKVNLAFQDNRRREFEEPGSQETSLYFDLKTVNYHVSYQFHDHNGWITTVGLNGMRQSNANKGIETLIPEYSLFDIGGFVYSQKTAGKATFSGGLRYDNRHLHSKEFIEEAVLKFDDFTRSFSNVSGSLGVSFSAADNVILKANIARGFRAPAIPELASNGAHEGTNRYELGDRNLKSETSLQGDFDIEVSSEHVLFSVSAFYNRINNFIFYSKLNNTTGGDSLMEADGEFIPAYKFSQHTANLPGFEALIDIHPHPLDWLHWENSFSYVRGRFTKPVGETTNVPFVPSARWSSEVRVSLFPKAKTFRNTLFTVEGLNYFKQNHPFTSYDTETSTPGYFLLNAGLSTNVYHGSRKLFSVFILGNNLADVAYQNHLSRLKYTDVNAVTGRQGVFNMGRNFVFKVNVPF
ncbi:MAG: TonB-dependent receptor [Chitinophagaceae bacterium]|nr:TonB-dependent receptor [Chitinophagaceae bacterium]